MPLKELRISSTKSSPEICFNPDGIIKIKGRSMITNLTEFSQQTEAWINKYICQPQDLTCIDFYLEYLNTNNLKFYISLLYKIESIKLLNKNYIVNWYYDEGDTDIIEKGEYFSALMGVSFNFIMISDPFMAGLKT